MPKQTQRNRPNHSPSPRAGVTNDGRAPVLSERQQTHGDFKTNAEISQTLKNIFSGYTIHNPVHREALDMIAVKLSRILSGQPHHADHWLDISGYALLAVEQCDTGFAT